jgi:hypothetical protein
MPSRSFRITTSLFLVLAAVSTATPAVAAPVPVNNYVCIDGSGSMYGTIDDLRNQVKMKLPSIMGPNDTLSMVVFSSRGEVHKVCEGVKMADFKSVYPLIDRLVRATNYTGFIDPLKEIAAMRDRVGAKHPGANSFWFLSDGDENQGSRAQVIDAMKLASAKMDSVTVVEFGRYANRALLTDMATVGNGRRLFAANFAAYEPEFEATMGRKLTGGKRVDVKLDGEPVAGLVYGFQGNDLLTFSVANGFVSVPEDVTAISYISATAVGDATRHLSLTQLAKDNNDKVKGDYTGLDNAYAALSLFAVRLKGEVVIPLLKALGDVKLIEAFSTCFGKEKYSDFEKLAREAAFGRGRFEKGYNPDAVPADDAFTVFRLLEILTKNPGNKLRIEEFEKSYAKIGRAKIASAENLTVDEAAKVGEYNAEIDVLRADMKGKRSSMVIEQIKEKIAVVEAKIQAILDSKSPALKFEATPVPEGIPMTSLVFNEETPNVSVLTTRQGKVALKDRIQAEMARLVADSKATPANDSENADKLLQIAKIPEVMDTFRYRNYAPIKDGWCNADELPVRLTKATLDELVAAGFTMAMLKDPPTSFPTAGDVDVTIILKGMPTMNRQMVKETSALKLFELEYRLTKLRAAQKVYKAFKTETVGAKKSEGFVAIYGEHAEKFLKELGLTESGGFAPKVTTADPIDFYMSRILTVMLYEEGAKDKIAAGKAATGKLDTLPSMAELNKKIAANGKMAGGAALMAEVVKEVEAFKKSDVYTKAKDPETLFAAWIEGQADQTVKETRAALREKAQMVFSIIVGQVWFSEPEYATPVAFTIPTKKDPRNLLGTLATMTTVDGSKVDFIVGQEEEKVLV